MAIRQFAFTIGVDYKLLVYKVGKKRRISVDEETKVRVWEAAHALLDAKLGNLLAIRAELDRRLRGAKAREIEAKMKRGLQREQNTN
jgi:hypothetical protein